MAHTKSIYQKNREINKRKAAIVSKIIRHYKDENSIVTDSSTTFKDERNNQLIWEM